MKRGSVAGAGSRIESTVLLLLGVFTVVNVSLVVLKRRPGESRGGFEPPLLVPVLGAFVCASLIVVRVQSAITSADPAQRIAGGIVLISLVLYTVLKPKNPVSDPNLAGADGNPK